MRGNTENATVKWTNN